MDWLAVFVGVVVAGIFVSLSYELWIIPRRERRAIRDYLSTLAVHPAAAQMTVTEQLRELNREGDSR